MIGEPSQDRPVRVLGAAARACAIAVVLIGLLALVGWFTGWRKLASTRAHFIPTAPNTATSFVLLGSALLLWPRGRPVARSVAGGCAALVGVVALLRLTEYATGLDLRVDQWLFRFSAEKLGLAPVGRMALFTAVNFLIASVAFIALAQRERHPLLGGGGRILGVVVAFIGLAFLLGYAYGKPLLYGGQAIPMALNTAAAFFLLGSGMALLAARHDLAERLEARRHLAEAARAEREAHAALKQAQAQLVQSEKLAGLGQMVAGVAHEINNPLAFVGNNVAVLQRDVTAIAELLKLHQQAATAPAEQQPQLARQIAESSERLDVGYTLDNLAALIARSRDGLKRIQQIVKDLRDFARLDEADLHEVDLNAGIESTVNIIQGHAKKKRVSIETRLDPLPPLACYPAKINQVVMNLLANAIDACDEGGTVTVRTAADGDAITIEVADTGRGIDPAIRHRIFDPFFTTKPVGQGTGLGLSISYGIVQAHGGTIEVDSSPGSGSRFAVRLPRHVTRKTST